MATLDRAQQERWLKKDIPHRIRAVLPGLRISGPWSVALVPQPEAVSNRCVGDSLWEGRLVALRWLITFVKIAERSGRPARPTLRPTDVTISDFNGGVPLNLTSADAVKLALAWKGCSQASSHPTEFTNHPPVNEPEQAEALMIVVRHLEQTVYAAAAIDLRSITLTI